MQNVLFSASFTSDSSSAACKATTSEPPLLLETCPGRGRGAVSRGTGAISSTHVILLIPDIPLTGGRWYRPVTPLMVVPGPHLPLNNVTVQVSLLQVSSSLWGAHICREVAIAGENTRTCPVTGDLVEDNSNNKDRQDLLHLGVGREDCPC